MTEKTKNTIIRWTISSVVTFLAGFVMVLYTKMDSITLDSFKDGTIVGVLFIACRAGVKGVFELFLAWYNNKK